ncbi:ribosomal maturation YjgA family protein [Dyadobacter pollutisoli]|uniref:DUF2809 domain-containing protein n=1 Tax=Dyadobacter pollutisoli TaxID=2910158 RepID=A0A9E8SMX5_9BACT|nr:DUF2809 domain-containing protein [Dyadobacter pollutisoli]WAC15240.1 DUF2809 domain-containing protein [Dyadobacter pollutisoli]
MRLENQFVLRRNKSYLLLALLLFVTEVLIALFVRDAFIRPWGGDFLVVILLYCLLKGITNTSVLMAAGAVLLFSYLVETLQFFQIVKILGLETNVVANVVLGTSFSWSDMVAYTLGIVFVLIIEKMALRFQKI